MLFRNVFVVVWVAIAWSAAAADSVDLVVCAPGYPGDTEEAQETMDHLAGVIQDAAGVGAVTAVYHPTLDGGVETLAAGTAEMVIVPLPFYLMYRQRFDLRPVARVVQGASADEVWTLVAPRGAIGAPADLSGWQIVGMPGYAPRFVTSLALAGYGALPEDVEIGFNPRVLSALRKAAKGERVAVILDGSQSEALDSLPFAGDLEVLARSEPMTGMMLCRVGDRIDDGTAQKLTDAFLQLDKLDEGLLNTMRITRFESLPEDRLDDLVRVYDAKGPASP